jgi:hypothetical protein
MLTAAYGSVDKPTKLSTLKFSCWALLPRFKRTPFNRPTGLAEPAGSPFHGEEKQRLALDMHVNVPPSLLKALDGF